jgi:hypothetical protein
MISDLSHDFNYIPSSPAEQRKHAAGTIVYATDEISDKILMMIIEKLTVIGNNDNQSHTSI